MNKFAKSISANKSDILESRAKNLAEEATIEVESFVNNLRKELLQLKSKLNDLTDLAPENTFSLRPGIKNFVVSEWIKQLHSIKMQITVKELELQEAQEIYDEWFSESIDSKNTQTEETPKPNRKRGGTNNKTK